MEGERELISILFYLKSPFFLTLDILIWYLFEILIKESIQHRVGDSSGHGHHVAHCKDGQHQLLL